ncbi:aminotransferase class III-fold pyridoxal phosphate-dependent enzyme [Aliifodinibius salicampi]|uniref:Aminotransferase class III-fold pyridoxal phosphate-dependent enzyme n=1 Tax=Fodinibius salicampi TaxID=1920655 RepID=A0ABT3PY53_9BACT|nr:aminotransferase class III-fold pyridoxal phosphate-dependent enzyme [Fodinibius salicampi]MCW9712784.1 aminotransferase class III-fold pyridoxal phosphate-dependent enzyme [Fodinibius salicampi]
MELFDVYPLLDLEPVKADGNYVYTKDGTKYLDLYGGHAVISIGHTHPHYVKKISEQLQKLGFYSNSVQNSLQQELADKLGQLSGYDDHQLFLCNSGAESIENALKAASFHNERSKVVVFEQSFHGRTSAAIGITDKDEYSAPVNKRSETVFLELNDFDSLEKELTQEDVCALVIEGVQGIGGVHIPDDEFLKKARKLCSETGTLLILDEIQSGYGRTGKFFAHQYADIEADIVTIAKGMGNGFPVAGTIIGPDIEPFHGELGSTFGGNHLACTAAIAVLEVIKEEDLIDNAAFVGNDLLQQLGNLPEIKEVRGRGLMIGIEFPFAIKDLRSKLIEEEQILTGVASNPNVLRLLPPLSVTSSETDRFINALHNVLTQLKLS